MVSSTSWLEGVCGTDGNGVNTEGVDWVGNVVVIGGIVVRGCSIRKNCAAGRRVVGGCGTAACCVAGGAITDW